MNVGGAQPIRLTCSRETVIDRYFAWSPDGTQIAFASADWIYKMQADGSEVTNLTQDLACGWCCPLWQP